MSKSTGTTTRTITIYGGGDQNQKTIAVKESDKLADIRTMISNQWTLEQVRAFLGVGEAAIPNFHFYNQGGTRLSSQQEKEQRAALFQGTIQAHQSSQKTCGMVGVFLLAVLGWSPPLWFNLKKLGCGIKSDNHNTLTDEEKRKQQKERITALLLVVVFSSIFVLDFADALVDLAIFFQELIHGTDGHGNEYGILLGIMTLLGRVLAGVYGVAYRRIDESEYSDDEELKSLAIATYFFIELTIFMMEDGAAILFLAINTDNDLGFLETASTILTTICGVCFVGYSLYSIRTFSEALTISVTSVTIFPGHTRRDLGVAKCEKCKGGFVGLCSLSALGLAVSMVVLLFKEVLLDNDGTGDEEDSFPENEILQQRWKVVYSVGVSLCLFLSLRLLISFKAFEEWTVARQHMLQEYRDAFDDPNATKIPRGVKMSYGTQPAPTRQQMIAELYPF